MRRITGIEKKGLWEEQNSSERKGTKGRECRDEAAGRVLRLLRWKERHRRPAAMQEGWWDSRGGNASWGRCNGADAQGADGNWWGDQGWNDSAANISFAMGGRVLR